MKVLSWSFWREVRDWTSIMGSIAAVFAVYGWVAVMERRHANGEDLGFEPELPRSAHVCSGEDLDNDERRKIRTALGLVRGWDEGRGIYETAFGGGFETCLVVADLEDTRGGEWRWNGGEGGVIALDSETIEYEVPDLAETLLHEMLHARFDYVGGCRSCDLDEEHDRIEEYEDRFEDALYGDWWY